MRRVDRIIGEARMLRIRRAARAQGLSSRPVTPNDLAIEMEVADRILRDLMEGSLASGASSPSDGNGKAFDRRRGKLVDVFDREVLSPFVDACYAAVEGVIETMDPAGLVFASVYPKVFATIYPNADPSSPQELDAGRVRKAALADVATLAVEQALFEMLRRFHFTNDLRRTVSPYADPDGVDLLDGKVRRPKKLRAVAARKNAERLFKRKIQAASEANPVPKTDPVPKTGEGMTLEVEGASLLQAAETPV